MPVAVVGLYFGNFIMRAAIGQDIRDAVLNFWQIAAFVGNSVAFLLIGFETDLVGLYPSFFLMIAAYTAVTLARVASVYPVLAIFNQVSERIPIAWSNVAMLGGVSGALSIALAASLSGSAVLSDSDSALLPVWFLELRSYRLRFKHLCYRAT